VSTIHRPQPYRAGASIICHCSPPWAPRSRSQAHFGGRPQQQQPSSKLLSREPTGRPQHHQHLRRPCRLWLVAQLVLCTDCTVLQAWNTPPRWSPCAASSQSPLFTHAPPAKPARLNHPCLDAVARDPQPQSPRSRCCCWLVLVLVLGAPREDEMRTLQRLAGMRILMRSSASCSPFLVCGISIPLTPMTLVNRCFLKWQNVRTGQKPVVLCNSRSIMHQRQFRRHRTCWYW
jgi:hypothetical protein